MALKRIWPRGVIFHPGLSVLYLFSIIIFQKIFLHNAQTRTENDHPGPNPLQGHSYIPQGIQKKVIGESPQNRVALVCNYAALSHALSYGLTCSLFTLNLKKPALVLNKMPLDGCSAQYAPTTFYRLSFCNYNLSVNHVYIFLPAVCFWL